MSEDDLTVHEVAARMKVHPETVRMWARRGEFPNAYTLPGRAGYRIPASDVEAMRERYRSRPKESDE